MCPQVAIVCNKQETTRVWSAEGRRMSGFDIPESRVNFIPCVRWVRRGVANPNPSKVQLSKDELVEIIKETKEKLNIAESAGQSNNDEFNLENYDEEDESTNTAELLGIGSLAELPTQAEDNFSESDDSEKEDDVIKSSDNLILVGHVEGDSSVLEVYVYNEDEESLYVHHDLLLPAYPLCLEWMDYEPGAPKGSYCAVGSMSPIIEVWDVDVMNCIEPAFRLGRAASRKKGRNHVGHTDAVLALAWNRTFDHVLASGSVDNTLLLWDMENKIPSTTIKAFQDSVQCLEWHKLEAQSLLAGSVDKTAKVFDCRTPDPHQTWTLNGEAEKLVWNPLQPFMFFAGTSVGSLQCFDCRKGLMWTVEAHTKEVTGVAVSQQCPGLVVTASPDGATKVWDCHAAETSPPLVYEKDFNLGFVHCLELCPDSPFVIAAGGDNKENNFCVYDLQNLDVVKHHFESRELIQLVPETNNEESMQTENS